MLVLLPIQAWPAENEIGVWSPSWSPPGLRHSRPLVRRNRQPIGPTNPALAILPLAQRTFPLPIMTAHASTIGLLSSTRGKVLLHDAAADGFRGKERVLDLFAAITQVATREGSVGRSPVGRNDDGRTATP